MRALNKKDTELIYCAPPQQAAYHDIMGRPKRNTAQRSGSFHYGQVATPADTIGALTYFALIHLGK